MWAKDDITGVDLDAELVMEARQLEMSYFHKMRVYDKVPRSAAKGKPIVRTMWIDINKGDGPATDFRSRRVAMKFNEFVDPLLSASTPPLEAMRFMLHKAATNKKSQ